MLTIRFCNDNVRFVDSYMVILIFLHSPYDYVSGASYIAICFCAGLIYLCFFEMALFSLCVVSMVRFLSFNPGVVIHGGQRDPAANPADIRGAMRFEMRCEL